MSTPKTAGNSTTKKTSKKEALKNKTVETAKAAIKKEPIERESMYIYAEGMTQEEKKKFRRTVRAKLEQLERAIAKAGEDKKKLKELNAEKKAYITANHNPKYRG